MFINKKIALTIVSLLLVILVFYFSGIFNKKNNMEQDNILYFASTNYAPFYGEDLVENGFISEIVKTAFKDSGYDIVVDFLPFSRALENTKDGVYDGIYTFWYSDERSEFFVFSDPLPANDLVFFGLKKNDINFSTLEDLKPYKIGIITDYSYPKEFIDANLDIYETTIQRQNFQQLIQGKIDLVIEDKIVGTHVLRSFFPESVDLIEVIGEPIETSIQYVAFPKANPNHMNLMKDFNQSLQNIISDGVYNDILKKHGFYELFSL